VAQLVDAEALQLDRDLENEALFARHVSRRNAENPEAGRPRFNPPSQLNAFSQSENHRIAQMH